MSGNIDSILMTYLENQLQSISDDFRDHKEILFILETETSTKYNNALNALSRMKDRALQEASKYNDTKSINFINDKYAEIQNFINTNSNIRETIKTIDKYLTTFSDVTRTTEEYIKRFYTTSDFNERDRMLSELKTQFPNL